MSNVANGPYGTPVEIPLSASVDTQEDLGAIVKYDNANFALNSGYMRNGGATNARMYTDTTSGELCKRFFTSNGNQVDIVWDTNRFAIYLYKGLDNSIVTQYYPYTSKITSYNGEIDYNDIYFTSDNKILGIKYTGDAMYLYTMNINSDDSISEPTTIINSPATSYASATSVFLPRGKIQTSGATPTGTNVPILTSADYGFNGQGGSIVGIFYTNLTQSGTSNNIQLYYSNKTTSSLIASNLPWTPNAQVTAYYIDSGAKTSENMVVLYHAGDTNQGVIYYSTNVKTGAPPTWTQYVVPSSGIPRYLRDRGSNIQLYYESVGGTGVVNITVAYPSGITFTPQIPKNSTVFATSTQNNYCNPFGVHGICSTTVGGTAYTKVPFSLTQYYQGDAAVLDDYYMYCAATNNNSKNPDVALSHGSIACKTFNGEPVLYTTSTVYGSNWTAQWDSGNALHAYGDINPYYCPIFAGNYTINNITTYLTSIKSASNKFYIYSVYTSAAFPDGGNLFLNKLKAREIIPGVLLFNFSGSDCIIDTNKGTVEKNLSGIVTSTIYPITKTGGSVTGNIQFNAYNDYTNAVDTGLRPEGTALSAQIVDVICFDHIEYANMFLNGQMTGTNGGKILNDANIGAAYSYTSPRVLKQQTPASWFTLTYVSDNRLPVPIASTGDFFTGGLVFNSTEGAVLEENYIGWQLANIISQPIDSFFRLFGYRYMSDGSKIYSIELTGVDNGTVSGITLLCQANQMTFMCASSTKAYFKGKQKRLYSFDGGRNLNLYLDYNNLSTDSSTNSLDLSNDEILEGLYLSSTNELVWLTQRSGAIGLMYDRNGQLNTYDFSGLTSALDIYSLQNYGDVAVIEAQRSYNIGANYYNTYAFLSYDTSNAYPKFNTVNTTYDDFDGSTLKIQTSYLGLGEWKRQRVNRIVIRGKGLDNGHYQINTITEDGVYYGSVKTLTPTYGANAETYSVIDIIPDKPACLGMQLKISFWTATGSVPQKAVDASVFGITFFVSPEGDLQTINHVI